MILPRCSVFASLVMTPCSKRSIRPSENISVWMPRLRFWVRKSSTASGISPIPICSVAPSSMSSAMCEPMARDTSLGLPGTGSSTGRRSISTTRDELRDVDEAVAERTRHLAVDQRDHRRRALRRRLRALDADAVGAESVIVGGRDVNERDVHRLQPRVDEPRDLRKEDRHVVGAAVGDRFADVGAGEDRPVAEGARVLGSRVLRLAEHHEVGHFDPFELGGARRHGVGQLERRVAAGVHPDVVARANDLHRLVGGHHLAAKSLVPLHRQFSFLVAAAAPGVQGGPGVSDRPCTRASDGCTQAPWWR